jgi:exopolysaccharide biosynthesis polyprenyl glycosylphosphotransferase
MSNSQKAARFWILILPTVVFFYAALFLSIAIRYPEGLSHQKLLIHLKAFTIIQIFWMLVFFSHQLFDLAVLRRYTTIFFSLLSAHLVGLVVAIVYFYFQPNLILTPRRFFLLDIGISFALILAWYLLVKVLFKAGRLEKIYLFSFDHELAELEEEIKKHDFLGFRVQGHLNEQDLNRLPIDQKISIILPPNLPSKPEVLNKFYELRKRGIIFYNYDSFYENLLRRVYLSHLNENWFLENIDYRKKPLYQFFKRLLDILFGIAGAVVFIVTFPFIALLVKLTSQGQIFFIQNRVGKFGQPFKVYKYRSMTLGAGDTWTKDNDPRITVFGKFLRRGRLDELPQFINLLIGDMSLVGPRPEQANIVKNLKDQIPFYEERHMVKPGITGWGQLNIYASNFQESRLKQEYDLFYIKNRSALFDLEIILKTLYFIINGSGR